MTLPVCSCVAAPPAAAPVTVGPTVELGRHVETQLGTDDGSGDEPWVFGVIADPHIYMYEWSDGRLAASFRQWAGIGAKFGAVVGDFGTGKSLRPDGDTQTRQMDKFAQTIAAVKDCPPVVLSIRIAI